MKSSTSVAHLPELEGDARNCSRKCSAKQVKEKLCFRIRLSLRRKRFPGTLFEDHLLYFLNVIFIEKPLGTL
jgi:hypothetical protein